MQGRRVIYYKSIEFWIYLQETLASPKRSLHHRAKSEKNNIAPRNYRAAAVLSI